MSPRGLLVPLLTLAGTATAAAVAYGYGSRRIAMAAYAHRKRNDASSQENDKKAAKKKAKKSTSKQLDTDTSTKPVTKTDKTDESLEVKETPRSSMLLLMFLQDGAMLVAAFGICIMVITVLVSLALVSMSDKLTSPDELQMFPPLMGIAMTMIAGGMLTSMLRYSRRGANRGRPAYTMSKSDSVTMKPVRTVEVESDDDNDDDADDGEGSDSKEEQPEKRVSRCPFGFG